MMRQGETGLHPRAEEHGYRSAQRPYHTVKHDHRETVKNDQTVTLQEVTAFLRWKKATRSPEY